MKMLIETQVFENYGAHDWDGTGECPQYWKAKGGDEFFILIGSSINDKAIRDLFNRVSATLEQNDNYYQIDVCEWQIVDDDYMTLDERNQMEFDGQINYPAKVLSDTGEKH